MDRTEILDSAGDGYLRAGGAFKHGHNTLAEEYATSREVFGACGGAFLIRRSLWDALGGFDPRFFMVYEDVDLSYRARLLGHRCWYAANAVGATPAVRPRRGQPPRCFTANATSSGRGSRTRRVRCSSGPLSHTSFMRPRGSCITREPADWSRR